jgi:hypothetical protein
MDTIDILLIIGLTMALVAIVVMTEWKNDD